MNSILNEHFPLLPKIYEPEDHIEWTLVLNEIRSFLDAETLVTVTDVDQTPIVISHRLNPLNTPPAEKQLAVNPLQLYEILIVGNICDQTKFSELTLDMFRILQALEREPVDDQSSRLHNDQSPAAARVKQIYQGGMPGQPLSNSAQGMMPNPMQQNALVGDRNFMRDNPHK